MHLHKQVHGVESPNFGNSEERNIMNNMNNMEKIWGVLGSIGAAYRPAATIMLSLGCLDFLHRKSGAIKGDSIVPEWLNRFSFDQVNWSEGTVKIKGRVMKLGKWLRKQGAFQNEIHEFETRKGLEFVWKITTSPEEVLSMSYDRAWTSCMRPGGAFEYGPLWDCEAGSALILFYRPGASQPCGREILRPAIRKEKDKWTPRIVRGGRIYGTGTNVPGKTITEEMEVGESSPKDHLYGIQGQIYLDNNGRGQFAPSEVDLRSIWQERFILAFRPWLGKNVPTKAKEIMALLAKEKKEKKKEKEVIKQKQGWPCGQQGSCRAADRMMREASHTLNKRATEALSDKSKPTARVCIAPVKEELLDGDGKGWVLGAGMDLEVQDHSLRHAIGIPSTYGYQVRWMYWVEIDDTTWVYAPEEIRNRPSVFRSCFTITQRPEHGSAMLLIRPEGKHECRRPRHLATLD